MAKIINRNKTEVDESTEKPSKARIDEDTAFWLNQTKSGKGVIIVIEDQAFISSLANIREFVDGTRKGVRFNLLKPYKED